MAVELPELASDDMGFTEPAWKSKGQVRKAGWTYVDPLASGYEREAARQVINNWRSAHGYPLNTFQMTLRRRAKAIDPNSDVVQRLKRIASIEKKLKRQNRALSSIQDIGGCRAVVKDMKALDALVHEYDQSRWSHQFVKKDDYLRDEPGPKLDGYRSVHLVYRHYSERRPEWDSLMVELQIRTRVQHAWATAVESVDALTNQSLKLGGGDDEWKRFFTLMSSELAMRERLPTVPDTPSERKDVRAELRVLTDRLDVVNQLESHRTIMDVATNYADPDSAWFLLERRGSRKGMGSSVTVEWFTKAEYPQAAERYANLEREIGDDPTRDAVLVSADSLAALKRAYPNYYADTGEFVLMLQSAVGRPATLKTGRRRVNAR